MSSIVEKLRFRMRHVSVWRIENRFGRRHAAGRGDAHDRPPELPKKDIAVSIPGAANSRQIQAAHGFRRPSGNIDLPQFSAGVKGDKPAIRFPEQQTACGFRARQGPHFERIQSSKIDARYAVGAARHQGQLPPIRGKRECTG